MAELKNHFGALRELDAGNGLKGQYYSLPALEEAGLGEIHTMPVSLRILLESLLRNCGRPGVTEDHVRNLASWEPNVPRTEEIPFYVSRVLLQDFTGVPLLVDLAAMRSAVARMGRDPSIVEPEIPVDLVIDHSVQVDFAGRPDAFRNNLEMEFLRNRERYQFLKWGTQAFRSFRVIPPSIGIIHQVNLEYLAKGVMQRDGVIFPDTLVGTDSHTTMINGLGIVGWGVGGIEAEAGMLGQPISFLTPDVVGVYMTGQPAPGITATDIALTVTQLLRKVGVVGKFVEFFGPGAEAMPVTDRATIANMAPEYGATMGYFPIDEKCVEYLRLTGRPEELCRLYEAYYKAQGLFGMPKEGQIRYSQVVELDLSKVQPSVSGPKRPQDRVDLKDLKQWFADVITRPLSEGGYGKTLDEVCKEVELNGNRDVHRSVEWQAGLHHPYVSPSESEMRDQHPSPDNVVVKRETLHGRVRHGSILIAAITSCTNTSNPTVMLAAGLVAKKAVERGLQVNGLIKTSLAPGSRAVTAYLEKSGLQEYLNQLGFYLVGYGCTTCIGNSGPLESHIEEAVLEHDLVTASVLSGNRNFEARIHQTIKANFLMSPPLVVAFALAGRIDIDITREPIGFDPQGQPVYLKDIWPTPEELQAVLPFALDPEIYRKLYANIEQANPRWNEIQAPTGKTYQWDPQSTYIQEPPFFENFKMEPDPIQEIKDARVLAIFGDSVTTDHISPAGAIKKDSPAGKYLMEHGVRPEDFNSYGSRRGNHQVMIRGTFANVRIKNLMLGGEEGGYTIHQPSGEKMTIYDAAMRYKQEGVPLIVLAGKEYGTGSSRDWAAKGTALLGVRAVVAESFERIHRSNLIGMGVLPLQFKEGYNVRRLGLNGTETYSIIGLNDNLQPQQDLLLLVRRSNGSVETVPVLCRVDTPVELEYYRHGGILPYVLRQLVRWAEAQPSPLNRG